MLDGKLILNVYKCSNDMFWHVFFVSKDVVKIKWRLIKFMLRIFVVFRFGRWLYQQDFPVGTVLYNVNNSSNLWEELFWIDPRYYRTIM